MKTVNAELKKVVGRVKNAQTQFQNLLKSGTWVEEARKYADRQRKEVKKLLTADFGKVRTFLERERRELEKFQKQIPGELKKLSKFVTSQRKELEKLLANVRRVAANGVGGRAKKKAAAPRKRAAKKTEGAQPSAQA